jgi:hypothetical protein
MWSYGNQGQQIISGSPATAFWEALKTRRSVRAYTAKPVDRQIIDDIVNCRRMAPIGRRYGL